MSAHKYHNYHNYQSIYHNYQSDLKKSLKSLIKYSIYSFVYTVPSLKSDRTRFSSSSETDGSFLG